MLPYNYYLNIDLHAESMFCANFTKIKKGFILLNLKKYLSDISMKGFIDYYEYFEKGFSNTDMIKIITADWTEKSKKSRAGKARAIFKANLQYNALESIINSKMVDSTTKDKAKILLQKK